MKFSTAGRIEWTGIELDELVWQYPSNRLAFGSELTIKENQAAAIFTKDRIFSRGLKMYDYFGDVGSHVLSAVNLPLIRKAIPDIVEQRSIHAFIIFCSTKEYQFARKVFWGESAGQAGVGCEADASCRFRITHPKLFFETLIARYRRTSDDSLLKYLSKTIGIELFSRNHPYGWDATHSIGIGDWKDYGIKLLSLQFENYRQSFGAVGV